MQPARRVRPDDIIPIFVIGCPRSGTTLVGELIANSSEVYNGGESYVLFELRKWTATAHQELTPLFVPFIRDARLALRHLIVNVVTTAGKSCYVDHTPWYAFCLDEITNLFPAARFVHMVRDPAAVVGSLRSSYQSRYRWAGRTVSERVLLWKRCVNAVIPHEEDERVTVLRYEDLCARPDTECRDLFASLGLHWDDSFLCSFAKPHAPTLQRPFALAESTAGGLRFHKLPAPDVNARTRSILRALIPAEMTRYGYSAN